MEIVRNLTSSDSWVFSVFFLLFRQQLRAVIFFETDRPRQEFAKLVNSPMLKLGRIQKVLEDQLLTEDSTDITDPTMTQGCVSGICYSDEMGFDSDVMGCYSDLMGYEWKFNSGNDSRFDIEHGPVKGCEFSHEKR